MDSVKAGNFIVCMNKSELQKVLSDHPFIILKQSYDCYCYTLSGISKQPDFFRIHNRTGKIRIHDVVDQLVEIDFMPCNHKFLETINKMTDVQFEIFWGS